MSSSAAPPVLALEDATLRYGDRTVWEHLSLEIRPGEFLAVLGPNGSGKTSLIRVILGAAPLASGTVRTARGTTHGTRRAAGLRLGYIPQQHDLSHLTGLRGRDFVELGYDGHRAGTILTGLRYRAQRRRIVDQALAEVDATHLASRSVASLSGGEQQRLRVAQALAGDPELLLCDEPLLSLDPARQQQVAGLIDHRRRSHATPVLFVTHEINPILPLVDRVLYVVEGRFTIGPVADVMTSATLSRLYDAEVDVLHVRDRLVVVGTGDVLDATCAHHHGPQGGAY